MGLYRAALVAGGGLVALVLVGGCAATTDTGEASSQTTVTSKGASSAPPVKATVKPTAVASKPAGLLSVPPTKKPTTKPSTAKPTTKKPTTKPSVKKPTTKPKPKPKPTVSEVYYANCTAVKAAGADPIYRGQPGYSSKLDRDGDGVACEN